MVVSIRWQICSRMRKVDVLFARAFGVNCAKNLINWLGCVTHFHVHEFQTRSGNFLFNQILIFLVQSVFSLGIKTPNHPWSYASARRISGWFWWVQSSAWGLAPQQRR
jgi:hypothetical protein